MDKVLNKIDLIKDVADSVDLPQASVKKVFEAILEVVKNNLAEGTQVSITGFGNFVVKTRSARTGRNPKTGEIINIAASKVVSFRPGKLLKEALK